MTLFYFLSGAGIVTCGYTELTWFDFSCFYLKTAVDS